MHVPLTGDFDTHTGLGSRYPKLMSDLDAALGAFCTDLDKRGLAGRVLVATTSEFGRRVADNDGGGADHGAASFALMLGPVVAGVHGDPPRLDRLDDNGNLAATVPMVDYYAGLARWLGVSPSDVLAGSPSALPGLLVAN